MFKEIAANPTAHDYRHWFINHVRTIVPPDYALVELPDAHTAPRLIDKHLINPATPHELFAAFNAAWVDGAIARHAIVQPKLRWSDADAVCHDDQFWEERRKRVLSNVKLKHVGWRGIVKISRGDDTLYWCEDECCNGNGWTRLHYVAYQREAFLAELLLLLAKVAREHTPKVNRTVMCLNAPDFDLEQVPLERVILPADLKHEIVTSTEAFFKCITAFTGVGIPSKRGFLLAGLPGNGKTLMCQALANYIVQKYDVRMATLRVNGDLDNDDIVGLYEWGALHAPCIVLLEDVETVLTQTRVTRSGFLNALDGLNPRRGVLTLATTNHPEKLDPALANRPSRFDRVWRIPQPDDNQRREFLRLLFQNVTLRSQLEEDLINRTRGWSMAYVQELKATAVINAMQHDRTCLCDDDISYALDVLCKQYRSGKKSHSKDETEGDIGFAA